MCSLLIDDALLINQRHAELYRVLGGLQDRARQLLGLAWALEARLSIIAPTVVASDSESRVEPDKARETASCRVVVRADTLTLDGKEVALDATASRRVDVLLFFRKLAAAPRALWVSGQDISPGERWDRIIAKLPRRLLALVESKGGTGYRLRASAWRE